MVIRNRKELKFCLMADYMMNRGKFKPSFLDRFIHFFVPDHIMNFLIYMRKYQYYKYLSMRGG